MITVRRDTEFLSPPDNLHCAKRVRRKQAQFQDDLESPSENFADITGALHRRRPHRPQGYSDDLVDANSMVSDGDDFRLDSSNDGNKDRFIELAQAALEQATLEDESKGVIQEVVEALIARTGAPLVAEVISQQLRSQEVIEKIAERHEEDRRRRSAAKEPVFARNMLKEPPERVQQDDSDTLHKHRILHATRRQQISEFIWRLFRILLLSCLVGLVYHFVLAHHPNLF